MFPDSKKLGNTALKTLLTQSITWLSKENSRNFLSEKGTFVELELGKPAILKDHLYHL